MIPPHRQSEPVARNQCFSSCWNLSSALSWECFFLLLALLVLTVARNGQPCRLSLRRSETHFRCTDTFLVPSKTSSRDVAELSLKAWDIGRSSVAPWTWCVGTISNVEVQSLSQESGPSGCPPSLAKDLLPSGILQRGCKGRRGGG